MLGPKFSLFVNGLYTKRMYTGLQLMKMNTVGAYYTIQDGVNCEFTTTLSTAIATSADRKKYLIGCFFVNGNHFLLHCFEEQPCKLRIPAQQTTIRYCVDQTHAWVFLLWLLPLVYVFSLINERALEERNTAAANKTNKQTQQMEILYQYIIRLQASSSVTQITSSTEVTFKFGDKEVKTFHEVLGGIKKKKNLLNNLPCIRYYQEEKKKAKTPQQEKRTEHALCQMCADDSSIVAILVEKADGRFGVFTPLQVHIHLDDPKPTRMWKFYTLVHQSISRFIDFAEESDLTLTQETQEDISEQFVELQTLLVNDKQCASAEFLKQIRVSKPKVHDLKLVHSYTSNDKECAEFLQQMGVFKTKVEDLKLVHSYTLIRMQATGFCGLYAILDHAHTYKTASTHCRTLIETIRKASASASEKAFAPIWNKDKSAYYFDGVFAIALHNLLNPECTLPPEVTQHVLKSPPTKFDTNKYGYDFDLECHAVPLLQTLSNDFILVVIPTSPSDIMVPQLVYEKNNKKFKTTIRSNKDLADRSHGCVKGPRVVYNAHNTTLKTTARSNESLNEGSHPMWADISDDDHEYRIVNLFWGELPLYARDLSIVLFFNCGTCHFDLLQANFE